MADWYPASYYIQPHYSTMPEYLRIEDAIRPTLRLRRRVFWTRARDLGLAQWAPVGFRMDIYTTRTPNRPNRTTLDWMTPTEMVYSGYKPGGDWPGAWHWFEGPVSDDYWGSLSGFGSDGSGDGHDWIHFNPVLFEEYFQRRDTGYLQYLFAHEFGHSLGFGHGGDGIMDETPDHAEVNAEEIAAAKAYWGTT